MPGLADLVETLLARQWRVMIASGGFTYFTNALREQLALTATFANELSIVDGGTDRRGHWRYCRCGS